MNDSRSFLSHVTDLSRLKGRPHLQGQRGLPPHEAGAVTGRHRPGVRGHQGHAPAAPHGPADVSM